MISRVHLLHRRTTLAAAFLILLAIPLRAQNATQDPTWNPEQILKTETYVHPPAVVERIITAPRTDITFTNPSPDRSWFLKAQAPDRGDVHYYGKFHIELAGLQIDTKANRARTITMHPETGLYLVNPRTMATRTIEMPKGVVASAQVWSPNGNQIAYIGSTDDASNVFVADVATGKSVQITKTPLVATLVTTLTWTADGKSIVTVLVPDGRGSAPTHGKDGIEDGPEVRLTGGRVIQQVIHPSLLEDPHEKAMLEYYTTGQVALVDVRTRAVKKLGVPGMIRAIEISPDGHYFRVTRMVQPFSYLVPINNFGSVQELWDADGKVITTLATTPLNEGEGATTVDAQLGGRGNQASATDTAKRNIQWNPLGPGLVYLQSVFSANGAPGGAAMPARGGRGGGRNGRGGAGARTPSSVRFVSWAPPFGPGDAKVVYEGSGRLTNVSYSIDKSTMFVADSGTVFAVRVADPSKHYRLGSTVTLPAGGFGGRGGGGGGGFGAAADTSSTGGALATRRMADGTMAVIMASDHKSVYLSGTREPGAKWETEAPRPWVDKLDIESGQRTRVFESPADAFDEFVTALDDDYSVYIYDHESPTVIEDAWLRDARSGTSKQLTANKDVAPEVTQAQHKRFVVSRPRDGFSFWVDVTLPHDWRPGTRLPGIIWFYPREYTSQAEYDRSRFATNINRFPEVPAVRPASATKIWVAGGYAVIEPDIPIVGDSGRMNDNYTRDLRENLDAVLDAVVEAGYVDRGRMGIGGHSYGAFSTVNAMTLTPYFKAGIAGDGMYNRSLTPFGFQSERRNFFQAQSTYLDMSPFFRADKLTGALLMYHSLEDQNVGTAPISSIRMLHALQGLGKTAALYMYPYEDHSVATYQTDLDQWARWMAWFDVYVKNAKPEEKAAAVP